MTKNDNLYIEALKEGRNNMKDGISFNELIKHLGSKAYKRQVSLQSKLIN